MTALFDVPEPATLSTPAHDDPGMAGKPWDEDGVLRVLWAHFASQSWACIPQVTVAASDLPDAADWRTLSRADWRAQSADRRIDMLLARKPRKHDVGQVETLAVEVKVTRADFLNDVRHPEKQAPWREAATRHAYAVPAGLVRPEEVPEGSGLLAVKHAGPWGTVEWVKRTPYLPGHAPQVPARVLIALMHRSSTLEAHTRGWQTGPEAAGSPQELRAALKAAHKAAEKAEKRARRAEQKADAWRTAHALAVPDGHPCRWCGRPLTPLNPKDGWFKKWRHNDPADDKPCELAETAEAERVARLEYDQASAEERDRRVRMVHRWSFNELVDKEPWRAFLEFRIGATGMYDPKGPEPADVTPEGVNP